MPLSPGVLRGAGLVVSLVYATFIAWVFAAQPRNVAELAGGVAANLGVYRIDERSFSEGLVYFQADRFAEARAAFNRADPALRDATVQFYIAYACYRQGWGRFYSDDDLFRQGIAALERAKAAAPAGVVRVDDPNLKLHTSDELEVELRKGVARDASDLNPLRVFRERQ